MHHYHIRAYARSGEFVVADEDHTYGFSPGNKLLCLDADDSDFDFFETSGGGYFVTDALKATMEGYPFPELEYTKLDGLYTSPGSKDEKENLNEHSFWKVEIPFSGEPQDFYLWDKRFLVVSISALKFLMRNNGYADQIRGTVCGPEFTVLTNRFYITNGDLDGYFNNQYQKDMEKLEERETKARDEYRRRQGLPPLLR